MFTGSVVCNFLFCSSSLGDGVLLSIGVVLSRSSARNGSDPSWMHLVCSFLMVAPVALQTHDLLDNEDCLWSAWNHMMLQTTGTPGW